MSHIPSKTQRFAFFDQDFGSANTRKFTVFVPLLCIPTTRQTSTPEKKIIKFFHLPFCKTIRFTAYITEHALLLQSNSNQSITMKLSIAALLLTTSVATAFSPSSASSSSLHAARSSSLSATVDKVTTTLVPPSFSNPDISQIYAEHVQTTYG